MQIDTLFERAKLPEFRTIPAAKPGELTRANGWPKLEEFRIACRHSQERCKAEVTVQDCVYPGVIIRVPGLMATVRDGFRGPLKISSMVIDKRTTIAITNLESGSIIPLITYKTARDDTNDVRAILQIAA